MFTKDLIAKLQKMVDDHAPFVDAMGEHEIVIDVFEPAGDDAPGFYEYRGFTGDICFDKSADGVYDIISAFSPSSE